MLFKLRSAGLWAMALVLALLTYQTQFEDCGHMVSGAHYLIQRPTVETRNSKLESRNLSPLFSWDCLQAPCPEAR
jgi:hypothetical protein